MEKNGPDPAGTGASPAQFSLGDARYLLAEIIPFAFNWRCDVLGNIQEWEFNEWVHSRTGRPMGKAYQAWSAAAYIHACQELQINPEQLPRE